MTCCKAKANKILKGRYNVASVIWLDILSGPFYPFIPSPIYGIMHSLLLGDIFF